MNCKYCDVEEEWKHDESNHPSQEVLSDFHLETRNDKSIAQHYRKESHQNNLGIYQWEAKVAQKSPKVRERVQSHQHDDKQTHKLYP